MLQFLFILFISLLTLISLRLLHVVRRPRPGSRPPGTPTHLMIVLGSGGHTAEMLTMLRNLDVSKYTHRTYIVSSGDDFSAELAEGFDAKLSGRKVLPDVLRPGMRVLTVPRARKIHQSLISTPVSCVWCFIAVVKALSTPWEGPKTTSTKQQVTALPDAIITNGPATGVIVVLASYFLRFMGYGNSQQKMRTIYIESWARVKHLSLSGKILLRLVDRFVIQWKSLQQATGERGEYLGNLM